MATDLRLEVQGDSGNFAFDFNGTWTLEQEPRFKTAANPPELEAIVETWHVSGALILGAGAAATIAAWKAFLARFETRGAAFPDYVRVVRDPAATVERTLGPATYQGFRLESLRLEEPRVLPEAAHRSAVEVAFRVSAVRCFPNGNGIVGWQQSVAHRWENGLHILEWRTVLTTAEGTDAIAKAKAFAQIPIGTYGGSYHWETNGPDGIEFETDDADEKSDDPTDVRASSRTVTRCIAVSRIRQKAITVGTNTPQAAPNFFRREVETIVERGIKTVVTRAEARGPGALTWCQGQKPADPIARTRELDVQSDHEAIIEWTQQWGAAGTGDEKADAGLGRWKMRAVISGGHEDAEHVRMSGLRPPKLAIGPLMEWRLDLDVVMELVAEAPTAADMPLPAELPAPWVLMLGKSREDAVPELVELGKSPATNKWRRTANLVYEAARKPTRRALESLYTGQPVRSYFLP